LSIDGRASWFDLWEVTELWLRSEVSNCKYAVELFVGEAKVMMLTRQTTKNYNEIKSYIAVFLGTENAFDEKPIIGLTYTVIKIVHVLNPAKLLLHTKYNF
jgi:hypothetical protein